MKNKIAGIPFALIGILLAFGAIVDIPMVLLNAKTQDRLTSLENNQVVTNINLKRVENIVSSTSAALVDEEEEPTPTPTRVIRVATPTPTGQ